jgi:hypothetical protein
MARDPDLSNLIASVPLFDGCSRTEQRLIHELATVCDVAERVVLCTEGQTGETFYAIARARCS